MHTMYMSQPAPATSGPYPSMPGAAAGNGGGGWGADWRRANSPDEPWTTIPFFFYYFSVISELQNSWQNGTKNFSDSQTFPCQHLPSPHTLFLQTRFRVHGRRDALHS